MLLLFVRIIIIVGITHVVFWKEYRITHNCNLLDLFHIYYRFWIRNICCNVFFQSRSSKNRRNYSNHHCSSSDIELKIKNVNKLFFHFHFISNNINNHNSCFAQLSDFLILRRRNNKNNRHIDCKNSDRDRDVFFSQHL